MSNLMKELERIIGQLPNNAGAQSAVQEIMSIFGQVQSILDSSADSNGSNNLQQLQSVLGQSNLPGIQQIQSILSSQNIDPGLLAALRPLFTQFESILTSALGSLNMNERSVLGILENLGRQNAPSSTPAVDTNEEII